MRGYQGEESNKQQRDLQRRVANLEEYCERGGGDRTINLTVVYSFSCVEQDLCACTCRCV